MPNEVKVNWPKTLALVFTRTPLMMERVTESTKGEPDQDVAYELGFSKEQIIWKSTEISPKDEPQELLTMKYVYKCPKHGAYYFPKVVVRPLKGKMLPKGIIHVHVDGELVVEGWISDFLPDLEPVDCLKATEWMKTKCLLRAHPMSKGGADGSKQIGFMLPNLSKVDVQLGHVTAEEKVSLEVGIITAYYSTKKSEVA